MIRFHTLGTVSLSDAGRGDCSALLPQSRRMALLTYLVLASPHGFKRRDSLIGCFWPELDQHHARQALRQALYVLRQAMGADLITRRGDDEVAIDGARLWCDAVEFEHQAHAGHLEEALALYHGDLLDGFFIADAPGFERWLEGERDRLRSRAAAVASVLADHSATTGGVGAVKWARRAVVLAPANESGLRRLIGALDRAGDRAGAVHAFMEGVRSMREDYGLEPSAEMLALIDEVRRRR